jgi:hypothetical protein
MRTANLLMATMLLMANLYFIPQTIWLLNHFGGPYYTIIPLLVSLFINATLFSALAVFNKKFNRSRFLLALHIIALVFTAFYCYVEISIYLEKNSDESIGF